MDSYVPRVVDAEIEAATHTAGAVVIRGARAVGKTESVRRVAASELRLDTSDPRAVLARAQPSTALEGAVPRLLDEWQVVPALWNEVRHAVDDRHGPGQFLLTGSTWPDDAPARHSGAGRFRQVTMRTMSLVETGDSTGTISLAGLFEDPGVPLADSGSGLRDVVSRIVRGGGPGGSGPARVRPWPRPAPTSRTSASTTFPQSLGRVAIPGA
ncbi:MAG: AAA family ATPase [Propionibacterium sp.]